VVVGKFNTLTLGEQEFYGTYRTQLLNAAFFFPMTLEQVPLSAYGGGLITLPTEEITLSVLALDPNGTATSNSFNDVFNTHFLSGARMSP